MKVGVNTYIVQEISGNGFSLDELKVDFVELGFDDVEVLTENGINWENLINISGLGIEFTIHAPTSDCKNVSIDLGYYSRMNIITMERVFKIASVLDAKIVIVHGGNIKESYHRAFVSTRKQIIEISDIAEDYGIKLLIENLPDNKIGVFPHELLPFIRENVGVCLDIGHAFLTAMRYGIPMDEFALLRADEVHIHDNNGNWDEHLPPGDGMIGRNYTRKIVMANSPRRVTLEIRRFSRPDRVFDAVEFAKSIMKVQAAEVSR